MQWVRNTMWFIIIQGHLLPGLKYVGQRCVDASWSRAGAVLKELHHEWDQSWSRWYQCYTCTMDVQHTKWWNWQGEGEFHHPNLSAWSTNSSNSTNGTDGKAAKQEMYKARIDNYMEILAAVSGSVVTVTWPTFSPRCYLFIFLITWISK